MERCELVEGKWRVVLVLLSGKMVNWFAGDDGRDTGGFLLAFVFILAVHVGISTVSQ